MKLFIISDIHGSEYYFERALEKFEVSGAERLVILGDILYHGARNDLPRDYNPKRIIDKLNEKKEYIIAVRGNCDSEVDQMVLSFPIMSEYSNILMENKYLFLTHGHKINKENIIPLPLNTCFLYGHTHIPEAEYKNGIYFLNPGSISIPKAGYNNSYAIIDNNSFKVFDFDDNIIKKIEFNI